MPADLLKEIFKTQVQPYKEGDRQGEPRRKDPWDNQLPNFILNLWPSISYFSTLFAVSTATIVTVNNDNK
jgi:hypothetical protein